MFCITSVLKKLTSFAAKHLQWSPSMKTNWANFLKNKHFLLPSTHTFEIHPFAFLPTGTLHLNGKKIVYYEHLFTTYNERLLILMLEKLSWFCLTSLTTLVLLMWKWRGLFLVKILLLRCWCWLSFLNWIRALWLSLLLKLPPRKLEP